MKPPKNEYKIKLVDICLIIILVVLLLQSAYTMFFSDGTSSSSIDVVVRTSSAGIFGYFISSNFNCQSKKKEKHQEDVPCFSPKRMDMQVIIATVFGLFCLICLIFLRNWPQLFDLPDDTTTIIAIASQFRDFVSGSVGFLIGHNGKKEED